MTITTISARDFARDLSTAKKATQNGPVIVTDRGKPTFALLKIDDYHALAGMRTPSLLAVMDAISGGDFEFDPPPLVGNGLRPADFG